MEWVWMSSWTCWMKRSQGNQFGDMACIKARNKKAISLPSVSRGLLGQGPCQASLVGKAVGRDKAIRRAAGARSSAGTRPSAGQTEGCAKKPAQKAKVIRLAKYCL